MSHVTNYAKIAMFIVAGYTLQPGYAPQQQVPGYAAPPGVPQQPGYGQYAAQPGAPVPTNTGVEISFVIVWIG